MELCCQSQMYVRKKLEIEEVMQQKAPGVPSNSGIHYPQRSSSAAVTRKGFSANFFKTTFSSRVKAVPTAGSSYSVEETTKIGSAETKPVTRNRPRTVPPTESTLKKSVLRSKSSKRVDKPTEPERSISRTSQLTPDPGGVKKQHDLKSPNVVLQIVKRSHAPAKPLPKTPDKTETILPPSLKPKVPEKTKSKTRTINNNNVWNNANDAKIIGKKLSVQPIRFSNGVRGPGDELSIEEVMQQKAPGVPSNSGIHYPQRSSSAAVTRKGFSANFFKTTFSSRVKAVPTAGSSYSVEETTKIGSAETKPVTRNRPRTVPPTESTLKKSVLRSKSSKRVDKPTEPERSISRTSQLTPDPGGPIRVFTIDNIEQSERTGFHIGSGRPHAAAAGHSPPSLFLFQTANVTNRGCASSLSTPVPTIANLPEHEK
ncbi:hypothetical protein MSG28_005619 [Choristoneura fumiferana]|uniref:Uncharacterized protein n=1 Tax=Choristoneura fumiferana TaxID=7141 RepID=A0ACC0L0I4_CHOFU|nr:hypothetical protein MSG28_005619 [Choristoneura fumiferana]